MNNIRSSDDIDIADGFEEDTRVPDQTMRFIEETEDLMHQRSLSRTQNPKQFGKDSYNVDSSKNYSSKRATAKL